MIRLYALSSAPPFARGRVRDLRVRRALREADWSYEVELLDVEARTSAAYREVQPFAQVPAMEKDGRSLFESGAIVMSIAERSSSLLPARGSDRENAKAWLFAALNTVEFAVLPLTVLDLSLDGTMSKEERRPAIVEAACKRLGQLQDALSGRSFLVGDFSVADLVMTTVLRFAADELLAGFPILMAHKAGCEARPTFVAALTEQLAQVSFEGRGSAA